MGVFGDGALETLYQKSVIFQVRTNLSRLLCILNISLLFLAAIRLSDPNYILLILTVEAVLCFLLQIILLARPVLTKFVLYGTIQLVVLISISFYPSGHSALLPTILAIFTIYSLIPLPLYPAIAIGAFLSVSQLVALYFFMKPDEQPINQVGFWLSY